MPLTAKLLFADLFARWAWPVVLVARTMLGTINHSLLSIEALRRRGVPILGIASIGDAQPEREDTIVRIGDVKQLGRLPLLHPLEARTLTRAFAAISTWTIFGDPLADLASLHGARGRADPTRQPRSLGTITAIDLLDPVGSGYLAPLGPRLLAHFQAHDPLV